MESKINYTLVGVFVVILATGLTAFAYWLARHGGEQEYDFYKVYMSESVAGLSPDASVKYRGVNVGTVDYIGLNPENSEQVELTLKIKKDTPIKIDTTATLKLFGLTGLAYIELGGGSQDSPLLRESDNNKMPVISSKPSIFARIDESMSDITGKSALALSRLVSLLNEDNLKNIGDALAESKMLIKDVRDQLKGFRELVDHGVIMEKHVTAAFKRVESASLSVRKMADSLNENYADVGPKLSQDVGHSLQSFNQLLYELTLLTGNLQRTIQSFEASPGDLIFKHSQPKPGPGEEGYHEN